LNWIYESCFEKIKNIAWKLDILNWSIFSENTVYKYLFSFFFQIFSGNAEHESGEKNLKKWKKNFQASCLLKKKQVCFYEILYLLFRSKYYHNRIIKLWTARYLQVLHLHTSETGSKKCGKIMNGQSIRIHMLFKWMVSWDPKNKLNFFHSDYI
jgi:hypothetical protein